MHRNTINLHKDAKLWRQHDLQASHGRATTPTVAPDARTRIRQRIKSLLENRGQTNRAFAKWLGHKDQWASNLLAGRFALSLDELDRAAAFLNVPPSELVRVADEAQELSPTERRVVEALRMLPTPVRDHMVLLADYLVGVTPKEVELLARMRKLTPDELRRVTHWTDVTLFAREPAPAPIHLPDLDQLSRGEAAGPPKRTSRTKRT
jgi:transcriptional regulator with XRE-family HTH domain